MNGHRHRKKSSNITGQERSGNYHPKVEPESSEEIWCSYYRRQGLGRTGKKGIVYQDSVQGGYGALENIKVG